MEKSERRRSYLRFLAVGIGLLTLIGGVLQGGYQDTWNKAVRICLECVGIG